MLRRFTPFLTAFALLALGCGGSDRQEPGTAGPRVEIVVDLVRARDGRIPVSVKAINMGSGAYEFYSTGREPEYTYDGVEFIDAEGEIIPYTTEGGRYLLDPVEGDAIEAIYHTVPGGMGRHGHQGAVADDFAVFDGRLFVLPRAIRWSGSARIRFVTPEGWSVASPFRLTGDGYVVDDVPRRSIQKTLSKTCVGVGRFDLDSRRFGEMEVRVATYSAWDAAHKQALRDKTYKLIGYFHERLGFDLHRPYSVVWTPKYRGKRVFGGSNANGTCFEHPEDKVRNWQLLAHRAAHAMNKYQPSGILYATPEDRWFKEAWASYIEVVATEAVGIVEDQSYWNDLYLRYKSGRTRNPELDLAMVDERSASGETQEWMHYTKAPLVVKMLEYAVEARSGKELESFAREVWHEHGWRKKPGLALRQELEAFTGASFEDFWAVMIDRPGLVIPVWTEWLSRNVRDAATLAPAGVVGGKPVSGDYLRHLAASGDFETFAALRDFVVAEEKKRRALAASGVKLYPEAIAARLYVLPAADRYAIARLEASYPLDDGPIDPATLQFVPDRGTDDGRLFDRLLNMEQRQGSEAAWAWWERHYRPEPRRRVPARKAPGAAPPAAPEG